MTVAPSHMARSNIFPADVLPLMLEDIKPQPVTLNWLELEYVTEDSASNK